MMFLYLINHQTVDKPIIKIPYWQVDFNFTRQEVSLDWFDYGDRHEEFNTGDYGNFSGIRKLIGYHAFHYIDLYSYPHFETYVTRLYNGTLQTYTYGATKLYYGLKMEIYNVVT